MAAPKAEPRVQVVSPTGERGSIPESQIANLPDGARVLSAQELAEERVAKEYASASTTQKLAGAASFLGPIGRGISELAGGVAPPALEAYRQGVAAGGSVGLYPAVAKEVTSAVSGEEAGKRYVRRLDDLQEAFPTAHGAGSFAGVVAPMVASGGSAAAAAAPAGAISAAGTPIEAAVARSLGGLATRGALGKAAQQGAAMAVRGAAEGAAYSAVETAASDYVHDRPQSGAKIYEAAGNGAVLGGVMGGILGAGGSLIGSGLRGAREARAARAALKEGTIPAPEPLRAEVPFVDTDAGLRTGPGKVEEPFSIGSERRPVHLRPGGRPSVDVADDPLSFSRSRAFDSEQLRFTKHPHAKSYETTVSVDVDALDKSWRNDTGFYYGKGEDPQLRRAGFRRFMEKNPDTPIQASRVSLTDPVPVSAGGTGESHVTFTDGRNRFSELRDSGARRVAVTIPKDQLAEFTERFGAKPLPKSGLAEHRFNLKLDLDAGLRAEEPAAQDIFRLSSAKQVPHDIDVSLRESIEPMASTSPIKVPELPSTPTQAVAKEAKAFMGGMLDAGEQAWRAVGGGQGLQTTRFAKEATRHFGSPAELGQIALKHGLIDMGAEGKSAFGAAYHAAKTGTPADILPRAKLATETVGKKLGEITETSGARVPMQKVIGVTDSVASKYAGRVGRRGLVSAANELGEDLRTVLQPGADGQVSIQDLLRQRQYLDDVVFEEAKTLDPKGRLVALREVRSKLESVITDALDEASGRMAGDLKAEYNALKRDYHGLRILSEAAEDSAARMAKNATFGLGEKMAMGSAIASGHLTAAPVLAVGGKTLRERGNAAAAAFLTRASKTGMFESMVRAYDRSLDRAASGVLLSGDRTDRATRALPVASAASRPSRRLTAGPAAGVVQSRSDDRKTQGQAQSIVKWVGDMNTNPQRFTRELEQTAEEIAQTIGPKAAEGYSASTMRALAFVSGYIPIKERRDPLDPRSVPPLMRDEAIRLVRATKYAFEPKTIFEDFGRGVITPEGLRAAKFIAPDSFEEFQLKLQEHVENHMLNNRQLTQSQRLRIDKLLGYPAGADLRPKSIARRQANYDVAMTDPAGSPPAPTGNGPVNLNTQQTGFDAIESRLAG